MKLPERLIIYAIVAAILFFGYKGVFGQSGALSLIKQQHIATKAQTELIINNLENLQAAQKEIQANIKAVKEQQEAIRQHIGTIAREDYHPSMKALKDATAEEQLEIIKKYNERIGLK